MYSLPEGERLSPFTVAARRNAHDAPPAIPPVAGLGLWAGALCEAGVWRWASHATVPLSIEPASRGPAEDEPEGRERSSGVFGPPGSYGAASSSDRSSLSAVRPLSVRDSCLSRPTASARGGSAVFKEDLWKDACRLAF